MMKTTEQVLEETQSTLQKSEQLIADAFGRIDETDRFFHSLGVERAGANRLMEGNLLTEAEKQKARAELAQWMEEVQTEIDQRVEQEKTASRTSSARPAGMRRGIRI